MTKRVVLLRWLFPYLISIALSISIGIVYMEAPRLRDRMLSWRNLWPIFSEICARIQMRVMFRQKCMRRRPTKPCSLSPLSPAEAASPSSSQPQVIGSVILSRNSRNLWCIFSPSFVRCSIVVISGNKAKQLSGPETRDCPLPLLPLLAALSTE